MFDGNPLEWNNWFELFQTAIGNNPKLTDEEKITYLQSLCVYKAKNVEESYGTNSSQYIQAIEELFADVTILNLLLQRLLGSWKTLSDYM